MCVCIFLLTLSFVFVEINGVYTSRQIKSYVGYKLLKSVPVQTNSQVEELLIRIDGVEGVSAWTRPKVNSSTYVFVSPSRYDYMKNVFDSIELRFNIIYDDANQLIQNENPNAYNATTPCRKRKMNWIAYHRYMVILNYMRSMTRYDIRSHYIRVGTSTERREIGMVRVGLGNKPGILIMGGLHAREWISPAVVTYMLDRLLKDPNRSQLLTNFDWYFVPLVNVDGYEYSHTTDRYWRKTRSKTNDTCYGVDLNRNWGFHWADEPSPSSLDPCNDYYRGPRQFSEPEVFQLSRTILGLKNILKVTVSLHSFSQLWLLPWSYTAEKPQDYDDMLRRAGLGQAALENTYGTKYTLGTSPDILYPSSGGSDDWMKGVAGINYSYTLELRDDGSTYGFNLPAEQIMPTGEETLNGIAAVINSF